MRELNTTYNAQAKGQQFRDNFVPFYQRQIDSWKSGNLKEKHIKRICRCYMKGKGRAKEQKALELANEIIEELGFDKLREEREEAEKEAKEAKEAAKEAAMFELAHKMAQATMFV